MLPSDATTIKVILVGSSGVGKSTLISSFFDAPFEEGIHPQPTVAPAACTQDIRLADGSEVHLSIWDTAGQERFQSISQMFYRESNIALVCFDLESESENSTWITRVREYTPQAKIILVLTKADLLSNEELDQSRERAQQMIQDENLQSYMQTSSKNGLGVKDLFFEAASIASQSFQPVPTVKNKVKLDDKESNQKKKSQCC